MIKNSYRHFLASTILATAVLAVSPAMAQTEKPADADAAEQADGEQIVVTGSLFRRTDTETPSPVTVLTAESLEKAGVEIAFDRN